MPLLIACAALVACPRAQAEDTGSDATIVVTGRVPSTEAQTLEAIRRMAQPVAGQLARFRQAVCPRVIGLGAEYEAKVARRIRMIADAVGAGAAAEGCVPNLNVVIVDDGRGFVAELHRLHPQVFEGLSKIEFEALANDESGARAWTRTALTNSVGQTAARAPSTAGGGAVRRDLQSIRFGDVNVLRVYESSNAEPSVQQAIASSWVVLETRATLGKSLAQLADYAALRGLAMVRPADLGSEGTLLSLFEPGTQAAPAGLTEFDRAYLTSLYHVHGRAWARQQVRQMADSIARGNARTVP